MNRKKRPVLLLLAVFMVPALLLAAVFGRQSEGDPDVYEMGEKISVYWFDFTLTGVETAKTWEGLEAEEGNILAVCSLELSNRSDRAVPMGWDDFLLRWGDESDPGEAAAPLPWQEDCQGQLPDEFDLQRGEDRSGVLVYQVPEDLERAALVFQERFDEGGDESRFAEGDRYMVWFDLGA